MGKSTRAKAAGKSATPLPKKVARHESSAGWLRYLLDPRTPIELPDYSPERLEQAAIAHAKSLAGIRAMEREAYEDRCHDRLELPDGGKPFRGGMSIFEHRVAVNYLRHLYTEYDELLGIISGGDAQSRREYQTARDGLSGYRAKVFRTIAEEYPYLADECARQQSLKSRVAP